MRQVRRERSFEFSDSAVVVGNATGEGAQVAGIGIWSGAQEPCVVRQAPLMCGQVLDLTFQTFAHYLSR